MPKRPYPSWRRRHDTILRLLLEDPTLSQTAIAKATGYSPSQVSRIMNSPDFADRYEIIFRDIALAARAKALQDIESARRRQSDDFPHE